MRPKTLATLAATLLLAAAGPAAATLLAPPLLAPAGGGGADHDVSTLPLTLSLQVGATTGGETPLAYEISLGEDATADWTVVSFTVIRDWDEGAASNPTAPTGWSLSVDQPHFLGWDADPGAALTEGQAATFGYTVADPPPQDQLFLYYVTKDGGTPFPVVSGDVTVLPPAETPVPEPASAALLGIAALTFAATRRRRS
ncbi:MAG: PEP-CTERM sorting domain-containing protein [Nitrospirae bacterium]|nr:MAG: PEP-CTERM sorting domain-containing protein [Nitrospirota bacterium]